MYCNSETFLWKIPLLYGNCRQIASKIVVLHLSNLHIFPNNTKASIWSNSSSNNYNNKITQSTYLFVSLSLQSSLCRVNLQNMLSCFNFVFFLFVLLFRKKGNKLNMHNASQSVSCINFLPHTILLIIFMSMQAIIMLRSVNDDATERLKNKKNKVFFLCLSLELIGCRCNIKVSVKVTRETTCI